MTIVMPCSPKAREDRLARAAEPPRQPRSRPMTTLTVVTLDVRSLDAGAAADRALAAFDALEPGERVEVVAGASLLPLLERLQAERCGQFEWSPLVDGPELIRVELARRTASGERSVTEALGWDHDRLEELEERAFEARAAGRFGEAAASYTAFALGLKRHIGFEEDLLFPEYERRSGIPAESGPTAVMRVEHREIESLLHAIEGVIGDRKANADALRADLHELLAGHNMKEERILYPGADRLMGQDERDELVRRIQAYRR
jgi:regulator of cell morphogenesis and NO signaling